MLKYGVWRLYFTYKKILCAIPEEYNIKTADPSQLPFDLELEWFIYETEQKYNKWNNYHYILSYTESEMAQSTKTVKKVGMMVSVICVPTMNCNICFFWILYPSITQLCVRCIWYSGSGI